MSVFVVEMYRKCNFSEKWAERLESALRSADCRSSVKEMCSAYFRDTRFARGLLCSPSPIGSTMQKCKHFCAALASLLVLETTN